MLLILNDILFAHIVCNCSCVSQDYTHTHASAINAYLELKKAFDYEALTILHTVVGRPGVFCPATGGTDAQ